MAGGAWVKRDRYLHSAVKLKMGSPACPAHLDRAAYFHTVPANTATEPLEKHYVSSLSQRQQGILVFLARDAEQRVFRYANAGIPKAEQSDEILRFIEFWKRHTGELSAELIGLVKTFV